MELTFVEELVHRLKVFQGMVPAAATLSPDLTLRQAQALMRQHRFSGLPVLEAGELVGLVTVEDIVKALDHGHIEEPVARWMTRDVVTADRRWPLARVMSILDRTGYGRLPVLDERGQLVGVITAESILRTLLVELNRLLAQDEERESAAIEVAGDSLRLVFEIAPGDFDRAGLASVRLKREMAARGISPQWQRRVAIAAHEAETNLIIHSTHGGRITVDLDPQHIRLRAEDDGPGIASLEQAMTPGWSTATDAVRALGFGAGMGLPNIKRNADHFEIRSKPGYGTRLNIRFDLAPTGADRLAASGGAAESGGAAPADDGREAGVGRGEVDHDVG